jgi:hypothetical protein
VSYSICMAAPLTSNRREPDQLSTDSAGPGLTMSAQMLGPICKRS